ncbi:hypothetical protein [Tessaracoccus sp. ZS01]|uniref:hypothetical protein n=1 Tax=Tessaracoccus sp. ZS01 TaxID=1906324 RepID=UPI00117FCC25|nr:hypothetical protein [Tessaracoccus sp. ZS01]
MRRLLAVVLVASAVVHVSALLLVGLVLLPVGESGRSFLLWPLSVTALVVGLGVVAWGVTTVVRVSAMAAPQPPPVRQAPAQLPPPESAPTPEGHSTVINPKREPAGSPQTPSEQQSQRPPGTWSTSTTPWPRADEEDPNGTLIRPPSRVNNRNA